ncbi:hypothetical protein NEMBOFW57_002723 [Staphylotrichum longicolle]|uniref:Uncharacterized protein n=1 Tax=Staphylotrichum longicolle TaxID=669026 RepID=A0AAD4F415_9PEZI|nr:hypothetical protein NEMBOFW57_002723 [Staphylotrichum longicolle]
MGEAAGSAEAQPVQGLPVSWASWGRGLLGEEREDEQFGGSFARITSNRQAETTGRLTDLGPMRAMVTCRRTGESQSGCAPAFVIEASR